MKRTDLRNIIREELGKVLEADTAQKIRNYVDRIRKLNDKISKSNNPEERRKLTQVKVKAEQDRQKLVKGIGAKPLKEGLEYGTIIDKLQAIKRELGYIEHDDADKNGLKLKKELNNLISNSISIAQKLYKNF